MARKQTRRGKDVRGGALGDFAEQVGTLLGQAEARWRTWQGAETREAIVGTVKDVRDRATALLKDMAVELPFSGASGTGKRRSARRPRKAAKAVRASSKAPARRNAARKEAARRVAPARAKVRR